MFDFSLVPTTVGISPGAQSPGQPETDIFGRLLNVGTGVFEAWVDLETSKLTQQWETERLNRQAAFEAARLGATAAPVAAFGGGGGAGNGVSLTTVLAIAAVGVGAVLVLTK